MSKPLSEKAKFYRLQSMVCDDLPVNAVNLAIADGYKANAVVLMQVRQGRIIKLPHLVKLIEVGLPDFVIPAELLPAEATAAPATLFQS